MRYRKLLNREVIRKGDEYWYPTDKIWVSSEVVGRTVYDMGGKYRRPLKSAVVAKTAAYKPKLSASQIAALKRIASCLLKTPQGRSAVRALLKKCASTSA